MKTILALFLAMVVGVASADGLPLQQSFELSKSSTSAAGASSASNSSGGQGVGSQGQSLTVDSHSTYQGTHIPPSTALAPNLTSSNDTCMGSSSMGASSAVFGVSIGSTWTDANCVMLKNSQLLWNMGFKGAALARVCMDPLNKEALEQTGLHCPEAVKPTPVVTDKTYN
jgi:hypothetical protein